MHSAFRSHVSACLSYFLLVSATWLFHAVLFGEMDWFFILSGAVMSCPCGCIAIRLLFCGTHHHYIHRFIAHGAASQDLARHHACIKKGSGHLRTIQDYSGRMASDLQGHSELFRVIPCLSATTLIGNPVWSVWTCPGIFNQNSTKTEKKKTYPVLSFSHQAACSW